MGYKGQTFEIPCDRGGLYNSPNIDRIPPEMMAEGTHNIGLEEDGWGKRGGTDLKHSGYGGAQIMGGFQFILDNGTEFLVVATADGKLWKDTTTTIKTGLASNVYVSFTPYNNSLYISNGSNTPQIWDGVAASTSDIANPHAGWTGSDQPTHLVVHGKGESERLWALGAFPKSVYAAALNTDGTTEADWTSAIIIYIESAIGGITAGIEFGDRIIVFSRERAFTIDDTNTDSGKWGYQAAQWTGGVAHWRLLVRTPNDLVAMMENGVIYSVVTAQSYGDYKLASLVKGAFIDRFLRNKTKFSDIEKFHSTYDKELEIIKFFVVRSGQTQVDSALLYYISRATELGPKEAWMLHDNTVNISGYSASVSFNFRLDPPEDHRDYIFTGGYAGDIWDLEEATKSDNGAAYTAKVKLPNHNFGNSRVRKDFKRMFVVVRPEGDINLSVNTWIDGAAFGSTQQISLAGAGAVYGTAIYGTDVYGGDEVLNKELELGVKGNRIQQELFNSGVGEDFFISGIQYDFKPLGKMPQGQ